MPRAGAAGAAATDDRPADLPPPWPPAIKPNAAAPPNTPAKPPKDELAAGPALVAAGPAPDPDGAGGRVGNSSWATSTASGMVRPPPLAAAESSMGRVSCSSSLAALNSLAVFSVAASEASRGSSSWSVMRLLALGSLPRRAPWVSGLSSLRPAVRPPVGHSPTDAAATSPDWCASGTALSGVVGCVAGSLISAMVILRSVVRLIAVVFNTGCWTLKNENYESDFRKRFQALNDRAIFLPLPLAFSLEDRPSSCIPPVLPCG